VEGIRILQHGDLRWRDSFASDSEENDSMSWLSIIFVKAAVISEECTNIPISLTSQWLFSIVVSLALTL
jgi:hypothetical protein